MSDIPFALQLPNIYGQIATVLSLPVPFLRTTGARDLFSPVQKQAAAVMNPLGRSTASVRREASPVGKTGGSTMDPGIGGGGGSESVLDSVRPLSA